MVETDVPLLYGLKQRYGYITSSFLHEHIMLQGPLRFAVYLFWRGAVKKVLKGSSTFY